MRFILLMMVAIGYLASCENKEKNEVPKKIIDGTLRNQDGDPVGTHRDANGRLYHDNNIFAPRRGEILSSIEKERVVIMMVAVLLMKMVTRRAMKKVLKQEVPKIIDHIGSLVGNYYKDNCFVNHIRKITNMASDDIFL